MVYWSQILSFHELTLKAQTNRTSKYTLRMMMIIVNSIYTRIYMYIYIYIYIYLYLHTYRYE